MYLSLNGTITGGRAPWPDFARLAAKIGFPAVDVNITAAFQAGADSTNSLFKELKIKPGVLGLPVEFRKDEETFNKDVARLDAYARFAVAIGCPRMTTWIMSSSPQPKEETRKFLHSRFRPIAQVLAKHNVRLGLEFLGPLHIRKAQPYEFIWKMGEMLEFALQCGANVGLLVDSWHWHHAGGTMADILSAGKQNIVHVQIADSADKPPEQIKDSERLMPGEGIIDFAGFFQGLARIGYKDAVSPEVFGRGLKDMAPEDGAKLGLQTSQAVMDKYLQATA